MANQVEIYCNNTQQKHFISEATKLKAVAEALYISLPNPVVGALVNNELRDLEFKVFKPKTIQFIDYSHVDGQRMYSRSLIFVLRKAVHELLGVAIEVHHSVSNGLYVELDNKIEITPVIIDQIKQKMQDIIADDFPFTSQIQLTSDVVNEFSRRQMFDKAKIFAQRKQLYTTVYYLDNLVDYFYGYLLPSTGYLKLFGLTPFHEGMLLLQPKADNPQELPRISNQSKMFDIVREHKHWLDVLELSDIGSINDLIREKKDGELIKISEALHENKIAQIANEIHQKQAKVKIVLISGPSSSGKTTFSKRLEVQLKVLGIKPISISLDNYFVDRDHTPLDENGEFNFEALEAIDIAQFNSDLLQLIAGEEIEQPIFDFKTGTRVYNGLKMRIRPEQIIIIEGIHGLNPGLTPQIDKRTTFRIYVSALTQLSMDRHNRIPSTDHRLLRRIVRDFKYRKYSAYETLKRWPSVRKGENINIFPFQEEADIMFNSSLLYELCVLKTQAEPLLREVQQNCPQYAEAKRLLKFLEYFDTVETDEIPPTSILREFAGGSSFKY